MQLETATNTAFVSMKGDVGTADVLTTINSFYHEPHLDREMRILVDMRHARIAMSPQEVREVVTFASADRGRRPGGRVAVVTGRGTDYGLVRIAQVYLEEVQIEFMVFKGTEEARRWLDGEGDYVPQFPILRPVPGAEERAG